MKKWNVYGKVVGSKFMGTYEAETDEEAEQLALKKEGHVSLCHQCSSECEDPEIVEVDVEEDE